MHPVHQVTPNKLLDFLLHEHRIKNDAALSRALGVAPPVLSKIRNKRMPLGDNMILRVHETYNMPVKKIRALMAEV